MLTAVLQALIAHRNPRRYVGRHRARSETIEFSVGVDAEVVLVPSQRTAEPVTASD